jgi:hypothetical protein
MHLGCGLGASHVHLESDSMRIVAASKKNYPCWSNFGHLIEDTQSLFPRMQHVSTYQVGREENIVAPGWLIYLLLSFWTMLESGQFGLGFRV